MSLGLRALFYTMGKYEIDYLTLYLPQWLFFTLQINIWKSFVEPVVRFYLNFEEDIFMLDVTEIKEIIPHRYPFLLVDKILELEEGKRAVGIKNVTINEPFFNGHFPDYPVMPGVLIIEALAQVGAVALLKKEENKGKIGFLAGVDNCRLKRQVKPGDQLRLEVEIVRMRSSFGKGKGIATVEGEVACEVDISFALGDK